MKMKRQKPIFPLCSPEYSSFNALSEWDDPQNEQFGFLRWGEDDNLDDTQHEFKSGACGYDALLGTYEYKTTKPFYSWVDEVENRPCGKIRFHERNIGERHIKYQHHKFGMARPTGLLQLSVRSPRHFL